MIPQMPNSRHMNTVHAMENLGKVKRSTMAVQDRGFDSRRSPALRNTKVLLQQMQNVWTGKGISVTGRDIGNERSKKFAKIWKLACVDLGGSSLPAEDGSIQPRRLRSATCFMFPGPCFAKTERLLP